MKTTTTTTAAAAFDSHTWSDDRTADDGVVQAVSSLSSGRRLSCTASWPSRQARSSKMHRCIHCYIRMCTFVDDDDGAGGDLVSSCDDAVLLLLGDVHLTSTTCTRSTVGSSNRCCCDSSARCRSSCLRLCSTPSALARTRSSSDHRCHPKCDSCCHKPAQLRNRSRSRIDQQCSS